MNVSDDDKIIAAIHRIDKRVERIERVLLGDEEADALLREEFLGTCR